MIVRVLIIEMLAAGLAAIAAAETATRPTQITVYSPAGKPVANCAVILVPATNSPIPYFFDGDLNPWFARGFHQWRTNAAGQCALPLSGEPAWIVAFAEDGWAHILRNDIKNEQIQLSKWATITGQAMHLGKPAAGWIAQAQRLMEPEILLHDPVIWSLTAKVDATGHFVIEHVPPGQMRVSLLVNHDGSAAPDAGGAGWLYPQTFELAAAETREVSLFGEGSPVRGSITIPPGASLDGLSAYAELDHREPSPAVPYPPEIYDGTSAERKAWFAKWEQTPAYQIWNKSSKAAREKCANYPVGWKSATTFQAEEVPPGNYDLDIKFVDPANQNKSIFASETVHFVVSTHASKLGDKALDLPPISLHRVPDRATVGQPALDFVVQSFDGKLIRLSDYRGKFVLLDFWATWCGPCIAEIPNLTACYEKFNSTGRFAILSVSYDESAAKAKAYVDAQHMPWGQAWIGNPQPPEVGEAYLNGLPTVLLIGPDGKVLATDIRGPEMVNHISDALK